MNRSKLHDLLTQLLVNGHAYTGYYRGRGWRTTAVDYTSEVCNQLDKLGITYKTGNDAPRGGVHGNYVKITMPAFIKEVKKIMALRKIEGFVQKTGVEEQEKRLEAAPRHRLISSKSEKDSVPFIGYTYMELISKAKQTIEWVTDEYKDDINGRYWLNVYHGAEVYELIIQNGRILGSICDGFYPTIPQVDGHNAITRDQWIEVLTEVINERLGDNWHFAKADGSCTHFFLREYPEDEELRSYVKMYMVPSKRYTGWHTNYEITASKQEHNDHPLLAFVEVQWPDIWYVKCPQCGETLISGCFDLPIPNWTKCKCSKARIYISRDPL